MPFLKVQIEDNQSHSHPQHMLASAHQQAQLRDVNQAVTRILLAAVNRGIK